MQDHQDFVRFQKLYPLARIPTRSRHGDAGFDIYANSGGIVTESVSVLEAGIAVAIPEGHVGLIMPRSGLSAKFGICVAGGVIDSNYRGELKVLLYRTTPGATPISAGERMAQLLVMPLCRMEAVEVYSLDETNRGDLGFGSSGR